jgi:hypothetical protein
MKKIILLLIISAQLSAAAQEIPRQSIQDSVIGWMKVYNFKGAKEPLKVDTKTYSVAQLSIADSIANWIQASYIPKGGLGDVKKTVSTEQFFNKYYSPALPPNYGATARVYYFLKKNSSGKLVPATSHVALWSIVANDVPPYFIRGLSTSSQAYFTIPGMDAELLKDPASAEYKEVKRYDLSNHPVVGKYISMVVPEAAGLQQFKVVILCRNNKLPFIHVTMGEVLRIAEEVIPVQWEIEKKKIFEKTQGNQKDIDFYTKSEIDKIERAKITLSKLREKYKSRINEPAYLNGENFELINLANGYDIFTGSSVEEQASSIKKTYPVYKVDPAIQALCKTDKPQWIYMSWTGAIHDPLEKHLHESIINNFNFDYVYNFFFDPEKVKGQQYKPLRSPSYKEAVVITEESETSKKNKVDKSTFFFEDFSTTAIGKQPSGWKSKLNYDGKSCTIATLDGESGNWVELKGNEALIPIQLKKPLPQNFTISYDVVAPQNFTWGGKGLAFQLSKETTPGNAESFLMVRIRPGFDGRNGEVEIETKFPSPPGYMNATKWMAAPGFSNNKKNNRITVTIKKKEENLQVFIDKNKIAEYEKAIPSALLFNAMSFTHGRSDGETEKFYISNIKITNE